MVAMTLLNKIDALKDEFAKNGVISSARKIKAFADLLVEIVDMADSYETSSADEVWKREMVAFDPSIIEVEEKGEKEKDDRQPYYIAPGEEVARETLEFTKNRTLYILGNMRKEVMNEIRKIAGPMEKVPGLKE